MLKRNPHKAFDSQDKSGQIQRIMYVGSRKVNLKFFKNFLGSVGFSIKRCGIALFTQRNCGGYRTVFKEKVRRPENIKKKKKF